MQGKSGWGSKSARQLGKQLQITVWVSGQKEVSLYHIATLLVTVMDYNDSCHSNNLMRGVRSVKKRGHGGSNHHLYPKDGRLNVKENGFSITNSSMAKPLE